MSLFQKAQPTATRLKCFVYGDTGTGKTITALSFPSPAIVDAEDGTLHYGKYKEFQVLRTKDVDTILAAIQELINDPNGIKTFIIDPITIINETLALSYENKLKIKKNKPDYTLQPLDYKYIKNKIKTLIYSLLALDMNIIVTARESIEYSQTEFMKAEGYKPDNAKGVPYLFDVVLRLWKDKDGRRMATVEKDRTNTLPEHFEFKYENFVQFMGIEGLDRDPIVFEQKKALSERLGRLCEITFEGEKFMTAGVTAESLGILKKFSDKFGKKEFTSILVDSFGTESVLDLKEDEAEFLIKKLEEITD